MADKPDNPHSGETSDMTSSTGLWRHRWFRVLSYLTLLLVAVLIAIPLVAKQQLAKYLLDNGADEAVIEDINFNPFTGTFELQGLDVKLAEKIVLSDSIIHIDLSWLELFEKGIVLEKVTLDSVTVDIEQRPDQSWRVGSLTFGGPDASHKEVADEVKQEIENAKQEAEEELAWWLGLEQVDIRNSQLRISSPQFKAVLHLDEVNLLRFDSRDGETDTQATLKLRLNDSPIAASINIDRHSPYMDIDGSIDIGMARLDDFADLVGDTLQKLTGYVNVKGDFNISLGSGVDARIGYKGFVDARNTDIANQAFATAGEAIRWEGELDLALKEASATQSANLTGALSVAGVSLSLSDQGLTASTGNLGWKGDVAYEGNDKSQSLRSNGELNGEQLAVVMDTAGMETATGIINWHGGMQYTAAESGQDIKLKGQLNGEEINLSMTEEDMSVRQQRISAAPDILLRLGSDTTDISGSTDLKLEGLSVTDTAKQLALLAVESIIVDDARAENLQQANVTSIAINGTSLIQGEGSESPSISIGDTTINALEWQGDSGLAINSIAVNKLAATLVRESDGSMDLISALQADAEASTEKEIAAAPAARNPSEAENQAAELSGAPDANATATDPIPIRIGELTIQQDSNFSFIDRSVKPVYKTTINIGSLSIKDVDSAQPDQPIAIALDGKINNYGKLNVEGSVRPFAQQPGVDMTIDIDGVTMVNISSYMIPATGYIIKAGQMDLDSTIVIDQGSIDAKNKLFMKKLRLTDAPGALVEENAGSIGMPLDTARGLLRDSRDNITLDVPIKGKLDEVDIGLGSIINTALKKATTVGMETYLLYAFQPYGALIMVGQAIGKQAGKITLDPVIFEAKQSGLSGTHKDYLGKLGKVMQDRPKIIVQICGYSTTKDLALKPEQKPVELSKVQVDEMIALGTARQKVIKDYLITTYKVDAGRLVICAPEHDEKDGAKPRVELLI